MVLSGILLKPFYSFTWSLLNIFKPRENTVFYCHTPVDMEMWLPVQKYLKALPIVTDKAKTAKALKKQGFNCKRMPVFPKAVIMCRVAAHKFPSDKVIKIGMNHGAYHFKKMTSAANYRPFTLFFFSSKSDLANAEAAGVTCGKAVGYPKLDPYYNFKKLKSSNKPIIVFTATYDKSGMSAIHLWVDKLGLLTEKYDIYVTLHPWMSRKYVKIIKNTEGVKLIEEESPLKYIAESDVCIGDTSSILAECCALDKPIITWKVPTSERTVPEIEEILATCTWQIATFEELEPAIERCLAHPEKLQEERKEASAIFFDELDGKAGFRVANEILKILPELKK